MVDKELKFLSENSTYGIVNKVNPMQNIDHNIIYIDGTSLKYGDAAEIFGAIRDNQLHDFFESVISETYFSREHYSLIFGYQPADYENKEIKEDEVRIYYIDIENTVLKKDFYKLCLLLCEAKMKTTINKNITGEEFILIKSQLEEKINYYG
jgi:hypothetical protein